MIRYFVLSLTALAVSAMVYEQQINLTTTQPKMRHSYPTPECYKPQNTVDEDNNGTGSACSCSQNAIVEWPWHSPQWWGVKLNEQRPIVALRVYIRLPVATCEDKLAPCAGWAKIGMCKEKPSFMQANCSLSCGFCKKDYVAPNPCTDVNATSCAWMASREECGRNPPYMFSKCPKSCNVCEPHFATEFNSFHNSDFENVNVYVGNTSNTDIFTNMSANIMDFLASGFTYFGTYDGPPANGEKSVVIRRATDTSVTGTYVILTKNKTDGILAFCEIQAWIHNPNNGSRMCIQNNTVEQQIALSDAKMNVPFAAGSCASPEKSIDGNTTDTGCSCAQNGINGTVNGTEYYWWSAVLANYSVIRGLHVWVRKEKPNCRDDDLACPGWSQIGMAYNESATMRDKCARSSGLCTTAVDSTTCADTNTSCTSWQGANECERNPPLMWKYCRKICTLCSAGDKYKTFYDSVNATFMNITVLVGVGPVDPQLLSQPAKPSGLTELTTLSAQVSDVNPTVIRVSLDKAVEGDFIVIRKSKAKGPLAICEVQVLGEPSKLRPRVS